MHWKNSNSETGQAIVYLVIGLVVFLGFVALAIDGGMALADRRHEQNAADSASLAGGGKAALDLDNANVTTGNWNCANLGTIMNHAEVAAYNRALGNSFTIVYPKGSNQHNYANATCSNSGKYMDITVEISATTQANFLQLFFPKALHNQVLAVTRVYPKPPLANGSAIVALNDDIHNCSMSTGAGFSGNADVYVDGGGIFSNGCLEGNSGSVDVDVNDGGIFYFKGAYKPGIFSPEPQPATDKITSDAYDIGTPDCSAAGAHNVLAKDWNLDKTGTIVNLEKGLWCITGDLKIVANTKIQASEVTLYLINGYLDIAAGADIQLTAPPVSPNPKPAIPGLLIYLPPTNHNAVTLNGNATSYFTGTILAPGSDITVNGTSNTDAYHSQIIGWNVKINGGAFFNIVYEEGENAHLPTTMDLNK